MKVYAYTKSLMLAVSLVVPAVAGAKGMQAGQVVLRPQLGQPVVLAGQKQKAFLKVALTGFALQADRERAPANIAIVLDKSGSMQGAKIREAKRAAIMAVQRLSAQDVVSIVTYDSSIRVVVPATRASDKHSIISAIQSIHAGGNTALFAGVSKGAGKLRKFLSEERVNRVILLSDGLANRGPSSPGELAELGARLVREGISVTTLGLGLGYNEDLMTQLAMASEGNHAFIENAGELAAIFDYEFGDVLSVVAQDVVIKIRCAEGIRPLRVLGRDAEISGNTVIVYMNQLYSQQDKYVLLEIELPAYVAGEVKNAAEVYVTYDNMITRRTDELKGLANFEVSASPREIEGRINREVMTEAVALLANAESKRAVVLRDQGRVSEARDVLEKNAEYLKQEAGKYNSQRLESLSADQEKSAEAVDDRSWSRTRKLLREQQYKTDTQQAW